MSLTLELSVRLLFFHLTTNNHIHNDDKIAFLNNLLHLRRVHDPCWELRLLSDPIESCGWLDPLGMTTEIEPASLLKQECEHPYASYAVTNVHVLIVVGNPTSQALGLFEPVVCDEVLDLGIHAATLL